MNIVGDYIYTPAKIGLKANDIAILTSSFYIWGEIELDIGPSLGITPTLTINPDGIIDFEDLATFTQMWYWSANIFKHRHLKFKLCFKDKKSICHDPILIFQQKCRCFLFEIGYKNELIMALI